MRRVHLLGLPNVQTTREYSLDGFCAHTIRFATLLKSLDYHVTLYASEENEAPCDELVTVITKAEQKEFIGETPYQVVSSMQKFWPLYELVNTRIVEEIGKRKQPRDFICTIGGVTQESIAKAHPDLMTVEYSIGYIASFANYRVFQSHTWQHCTYGFQEKAKGIDGGGNGRFFDTVIPLFLDPAEFPLVTRKDPYVLYVGRLTERKGVRIACQAAEAAGVPLKIIGHGDESLVTHGAEFLGPMQDSVRNEWMARAQALLCPTIYIEPFGAVAVEAQMCGTPVISTDFGGFVESVEDGVSGFRCNYLGEFVNAIKYAANLDPTVIRRRAERLYSMEAAAEQYHRYFDRLDLLWDKGWETV